MRRNRLVKILVAALAAIGVAAACTPAVDLARAKHENEKFKSLELATSAKYGYTQLRDAKGIACIDNPPIGGMGVHYVQSTLVGDDKVDALHPELLVYEPQRGDRMRLVALEYVVFQDAWDAKHSSPPRLFGQQFELTKAGNRYGLPAFYELHAWVYKANPLGMFNDWNPRVTCPVA